MAYLLDTVALVLWWGGSSVLGEGARRVLEEGDAIHLSAVSIWEIANKIRIGKLPQFDGFETRFPDLVRLSGFELLALTTDQALRAGYLPGPHRDPFDRLLAAQALTCEMTVLTNDPEIAAFGCKVLW